MIKYELGNGYFLEKTSDDTIKIANEEGTLASVSKEDFFKIISQLFFGEDKPHEITQALQTYHTQKNKTYTFWEDTSADTELSKYCWCQRPQDSNMSLDHFGEYGEVCGFMSESLASTRGLKQIDLETFIFKFIQPMVQKSVASPSEGEPKNEL